MNARRERWLDEVDWWQAIALADAILQQHGLGGVTVIDRAYRFVYFGPGMERLSGMASDAVLGRDVLEVFPFLRKTGDDRHVQAMLAGAAVAVRDRSFAIAETGRSGVYDAHYVPLRARDGTILGGLALIVDPSERKRAQAEVRESEQRFRTMADAAPVLLWISRTDGYCTYFNQTWLEFTGRSPDEEWGIGWAESVHFEDLQRCLDTYMDAFNQRKVFEVEYRLRRADGEYRWVLDRAVPRYLPDGRFAGYIGSCTDITDRKRAENELRKNVQTKDEFLGLVSHELRTPVTALQLQVERLRRMSGAFSPREREVVGRIASTTDRLVHLIESVLQVTRIESGKLRLEPVEFDLAAVASDLLDELRPGAERKGLRLSLRLEGELTPVHSDPEIVRLILSNLVSNAIKFTDSGSVEVTLCDLGAAHRITVRDTGRGIAREQHARIFGVFEQLEMTRNKHTPGVGLGLSLVKAMTTALGGVVNIESDLGKGSLFTVDVPKVQRSDDLPHDPEPVQV